MIKYLICIDHMFFFFLPSMAQKVFDTHNESRAEVKVFVTDKDYRADLIVYTTYPEHRTTGIDWIGEIPN